jgi:hypothetical protein
VVPTVRKPRATKRADEVPMSEIHVQDAVDWLGISYSGYIERDVEASLVV